MRFRRKSKAPAPRGGSVGAARGGASAQPKRQAASSHYDLGTNTGSDGLPGRAGYPNGPRTELPTFFLTRRPDGKPDPVYRKKAFFG